MKPEVLDEVLAKTLEDHRLSRGERKALSQVIDDLGPSPQDMALLRSRAFAVARQQLKDHRDAEVFEWFFDVLKLLMPHPGTERVAEAFFSPGDECVRRVVSLFRQAQRKVDVCVFTITDDRIAAAILEAHKRGVAVRILTDDDKTFDRGSDIERLNVAGVPVKMDNSEAHMHHKFALFDDRLLLTGSFNWTTSASRYNQENIIVTGEPRLIKAFSRVFEDLWREFG